MKPERPVHAVVQRVMMWLCRRCKATWPITDPFNPPVRCAKCRSPYWRTRRKAKEGKA